MKREDLFQVVFEDPELLIVNKPAGLVCHPTKTDEYSSLISRARLYLGEGSHPAIGEPAGSGDQRDHGDRPHERECPGAAKNLGEPRGGEGVSGDGAWPGGKAGGIIDAPLGEDLSSKVAIKDCVREDGYAARTEYWVEAHLDHEVAMEQAKKERLS